MAFLTINGVAIACEKASEVEPTPVGDTSRSWNGTMRSSVRAVKRRWQVTTVPLDTTTMGNVKSAIGTFLIRACSGDMFLGASVNCLVKYSAAELVSSGDTIAGYNFLWQMTITMDEA